MFALKKLKKNEIAQFLEKLSKYYECDTTELENYNFYINENNAKLYISKINPEELNLQKISGFGLYFGTFHDNQRFRASIEGSKFINPKKNIVIIGDENLKSYLAGENLFTHEVEKVDWQDNCPFLIVKYKNENLGCISVKDENLLNYIPKSRRLDFNKLF